MNPSLIGVALALAGQTLTAVWWAARLSAQVENLTAAVTAARDELHEIRTTVRIHGEDIAVLKSTNVTLRPASLGR